MEVISTVRPFGASRKDRGNDMKNRRLPNVATFSVMAVMLALSIHGVAAAVLAVELLDTEVMQPVGTLLKADDLLGDGISGRTPRAACLWCCVSAGRWACLVAGPRDGPSRNFAGR